MPLMIAKNILLALLLSVTLTLALGILYALYPLILALLSMVWERTASSGAETGGIGVVVGGVSGSVRTLVVMASIIFLFIFALLQKRGIKH